MPEQLAIDWTALDLDSTVPLRRAYRYRLAPTKTQAEALDAQRRAACRLYNAALQERIQGYRFGKKVVRPGVRITKSTQSAQIKDIQADGNLGVAHTDIAHDILHRVDEAFRAFFRRVKQGQEPGFPHYQPVARFDSFTYRREGPSCRVRENGKLFVGSVGELRVQWHRALEGDVKTITFKWDGKHWEVIFSCAVIRPTLPPSPEMVGLDLGLHTYAARSDRDADHPNIEPLKAYKKAQQTLARLQRELARRTRTDVNGRPLAKQSHRREKTKALVRAAHARVARQRQAFQHRETRKLVEEYGLIAIEELNLLGLSRGMLAKEVSDAAWGAFIQKLEEKAQETGRQLVRVNPSGTSQTCLCGEAVPKDLSIRWHVCQACGLSMDRDEVSAKVILQRALSV